MKKTTIWIAALVVLLGVCGQSARPVSADMAPPPPPSGANLLPGQDTTQVRMVSEQVVLDIPSTSQSKTWSAGVRAEFQMRNLGSAAESMNARFPMYMATDSPECNTISPYPAIQNFGVRVNGGAVSVTYDSVNATLIDGTTVQRPCWAYFPVLFPAGKDVTVTVTYKVDSNLIGHGSLNNYLSFSYILVTGAAWKDTIGAADIIVHLPFEANDQTIYETSDGAARGKNEVRWHFENFEPQNNIFLTILNPQIWDSIQKEKQNLAANPQDGEAEGRLAKAYKNAVVFDRGFREDAAGIELRRLSLEAYQKTVTLLPKDADWHYGYADLLCGEAVWPMNAADQDNLGANLTACIQQLKAALDINPTHAKALDLLHQIADNGNLGDSVVKFNGAKPDFLILTPGVYQSPTPYVYPDTATPTAKPTKPAAASATPAPDGPTATPQPSDTPVPAVDTSVPPTPTVSAPQPSPTHVPAARNPLCGSILLPLLGLGLALWFSRMRK